MKVDVAFVPEAFRTDDGVGRTVVIVDVLRASTTIITALAHGAEKVVPVATTTQAGEEAARYPKAKMLLCGERGSVRIPGFDLGNSPNDYGEETVRSKTLVYTSTNGSQMIVKSAGAATLLVAGFVNGKAVVERLRDGKHDCLIACSGTNGGFSLEDAVCAGFFVDGLVDAPHGQSLELGDGAKAARVLYDCFSKDLLTMAKEAVQGRILVSLGMEADIPLCVSVDSTDVVPVLSDGALIRSG
jgi:2-phosphosulfolactate phosphatase